MALSSSPSRALVGGALPTGRMACLETDRLILRPIEWRDLDALTVLHAEPSFWWFPMRRGMSPEESRRFIVQTHYGYYRDGVGPFAAIVKDTGKLVGWLGLGVPYYLPEVLPAIEVGGRLAERFRGEGYAVEGMTPMIRYGFEGFGIDRMLYIFDPANVAAGRVAKKLGFVFERQTIKPHDGEVLQVSKLARGQSKAANLPRPSF